MTAESPEPGWASAELEPIKLRHVLAATAEAFGYDVATLYVKDRDDPQKVLARRIAAYLCREMTCVSYPGIGRMLHRDHTSIMAARAFIAERITQDAQLASVVQRIRETVLARAAG